MLKITRNISARLVKFFLATLAWTLVVFVLILGLLHLSPIKNLGLGYAARVASSALGYHVTLSGLGDGWPYDLSLRELTLSDEKGLFLIARNIHFIWNPISLKQHRIKVKLAAIDSLNVLRVPAPPIEKVPVDPVAPMMAGQIKPFVVQRIIVKSAQYGKDQATLKLNGAIEGGLNEAIYQLTGQLKTAIVLAGHPDVPIQGDVQFKGLIDEAGRHAFSLPLLTLTAPDARLSGSAEMNDDQSIGGNFEIDVKNVERFQSSLAGNIKTDVSVQGSMVQPVVKLSARGSDILYRQKKIGALTADLILQKAISENKMNGWSLSPFVIDSSLMGLKGDVLIAPRVFSSPADSPQPQGWGITGTLDVAVKDHAQFMKVITDSPQNLRANYKIKAKMDISFDPMAQQTVQLLEASGTLRDAQFTVQEEPTISLAIKPSLKVIATAFTVKLDEAIIKGQGQWQDGRAEAQFSWKQMTSEVRRKLGLEKTAALGMSQGTLRIWGTPQIPSAEGKMSFYPQQPRPGVIDLSMHYDGQAISTDIAYQQQKKNLFTVKGRVNTGPPAQWFYPHLMQWPISLQVVGRLPMSVLASQGVIGEDVLPRDGNLVADVLVKGKVGAIEPQGSLNFEHGFYQQDQTGLILRDLTVHTTLTPSQLSINMVSANDGRGGTVKGAGNITYNSKNFLKDGASLRLNINADRMQVLRLDDRQATASAALLIAGDVLHRLTVGGKITVHSANIKIPDRVPVSVTALDVRSINGPARQSFAAKMTTKKQAAGVDTASRPYQVNLDVVVDAPNRIEISGRGLLCEVGGTLAVKGTLQQPNVTGHFNIIRGTYEFLDKTFSLNDGGVRFDGGDVTNPALDLKATQTLADMTASVLIGGTAKAPMISIESTPAYPQDEVLARLLFGKGVSGLSPMEAVQLANAVRSLAGGGPSLDITGNVRKKLGLDVLDVNSTVPQNEGEEAGKSLEVGKYLSDDVFLKVEQGLTQNSRKVGVDIRLTPLLSVESNVGADASSGINLKLQKDY